MENQPKTHKANSERPIFQANPNSGLIYQTIFTASQHYPAVLMDTDFKIVAMNQMAEVVYGIDERDAAGRLIRDVVKLDTSDYLRDEVRAEVKEMGTSICEGAYRRKDGRVFYFTFVFNKIVDEKGNAVGYTSIAKDNSALRRSDLANRLIVNMIEQSSHAMFTTNNELIIETWSNGAENLYGVPREQAVGKPIAALFPAPERLEHITREEILRKLDETGHWSGFLHNRFETVGEKFVHASIDRSYNLNGEPIGYVVVHRELTREFAESITEFLQSIGAQ